MMKINWVKHILFMTAITLVMSSCVPKVTEKKAVCGTNQAFDSVTRTCISTAEIRTRPVASLGTETLNQEIAKTITLTYTDGNKNSALSCKVNNVSPNIEAVSPKVINLGIFNAADLVSTAADSLVTSMPLAAATQPAAVLDRAAMFTALANAKKTFNYSTVIAQLTLFRVAVDNIIADAAPVALVNATTKADSDLTKARLLTYDPFYVFVENRCDCVGGICTTTIAPRMSQSGNASFTYTISDIDGESDPKIVDLSITAISKSTDFLAPVVESDFQTFAQNNVPASKKYSFTLPVARDYFGTASFNYTYSGALSGATPNGGRVTNCMNLTGSTGLTDITCDYYPASGDIYDTATPTKAAVVIDDLTFTAKKEGTFANSFKIQYIDLKNSPVSVVGIDPHIITKSESFGLISQVYSDTFIRVIGNTIQIYLVTGNVSTSDIKNLINSDSKAKSLVSVSGGSAATFPDPAVSTPAAVALVGGTDAFDTISYTVSNGFTSSTNSAKVLIKMSHTDHAPLVPTEFNAAYTPLILPAATTVAEAEGTIVGQTIILPYKDIDNLPIVKPVSCTVDFATPPNIGLGLTSLLAPCSCDGAGVCSVSVIPNALFNGTGKFSYTITTTDQFSVATLTSGSQAVNLSVWEVNDAPSFSLSSAVTKTGLVPVATTTVAPLPNPLPMQENSTAAPSSAFICFTANAGGGTDEASQILTTTAVQVLPVANPNLIITFGSIIKPSAIGNLCSTPATQYMVPFTTTQNQSGLTSITITVADNGTTHGIAAPLSVSQTIPIQVNSVDDPPYFIQSVTSVQTNEGGSVVAGPFTVDEDQGSSPDEDVQAIKIANITSDNAGVLPVSAISVFYDLNNNGVADTGEDRNFGTSSTAMTLDGLGVPVVALESVATDDVKGHSFYLKLSPIAGVAGNSNITITINDGNGAADHFISKSFSLITNPVAALHGGWSNISAVGIKTDKTGAPASSDDAICNYNKAADLHKCDTATTDCTGTTAPNSVVTPSAVNVLYYDSGSKRCYRSQGTDKFSWINISTTCPITRVTGTLSSVCSGENCLFDPTLLPAQTVPTATASGLYYYNTSTNTCFISTQPTPGVFAWTTPYIPSKVTISWNPFTITGSGADSSVQIEGWNVYRREAGFDYDFKNGFLKTVSTDTKTITSSTTRTFTDKTAIAGKVYYYLVRPIDSNHHFATYTPEIFSELRILAPKENYAFVHRWMVNQEICNSMHMTTATTNKVDPTHDYRCPYNGPGESTLHPGFYDIEKDMLVDIAEVGCPYTVAPACTSNGCIGIGDPVSLGLSTAANNIYYDRDLGACYISKGGGAWDTYAVAAGALINAASTKVNSTLNPPLTNITQAQSEVVCNARNVATDRGALIGAVPVATLPSKKEFIAYAAAPIGMSDSVLTDMEQGFSLNVQSRCNASSANGLEIAYTDSDIPSTSFIYSIPGTSSSGIRSLYTGSVPWVSDYSTETCSSRYGVQDVYGNVAEWVKDKMNCVPPTTLNGLAPIGTTTLTVFSTSGFPASGTVIIDTEVITYTAITATTLTVPGAGTLAAHASGSSVTASFVCTILPGTDLGNYDFGGGHKYAFDYLTGPYNETGNSIVDAADAFLTSWDFRDELYGAGKFSFPLGMPINVDIATASSLVLANSPAIPFLLDIGPTAGITSSQLHEDGIIVSGLRISLDPSHQGGFIQGGSYASGNRAGRYSSEVVPDSNVGPDIGFRCYIPIDSSTFPADPGRHTYSY